jgi:hypothetical protein
MRRQQQTESMLRIVDSNVSHKNDTELEVEPFMELLETKINTKPGQLIIKWIDKVVTANHIITANSNSTQQFLDTDLPWVQRIWRVCG